MTDFIDTPTVLLVSGSTQTIRSIDRLLSGPFKVLNAVDGAKAWEVLQETPSISLVVCSLRIATDRDALLERVRQARDKRIAGLPVLILVGENDSDASRQRAFSLGASDYISMPFSAAELQTRAGLQIRKFNQRIAEQEHEVVGASEVTDILNTLKQQEAFTARLKQEMSFCVRHRAYISVALLSVADEDSFTAQFDRSVLTALLRTLSRELEHQIRHEDSFAYLGDATFALLFPVTNGLGAKVAIERIMQRISDLKLKHEGAEIPLSQNAALYSTIPDDSLTTDDVMNALEQRLATARKKGAGQVISSKFEIENASLSIDQALNKIRYKQTDGLEQHLHDLIPRVRPLLQFARQHDAPELQDVLDDISD